MMRRGSAPAPTSTEVIDVLENSRGGQEALAATELATRIWWDRGGRGNPYKVGNDDPTPRVFPPRLKVVLEEMVRAGTLLPVSDHQNPHARLLMVPFWQHGATYYGLADQVRAVQQAEEQRLARRNEAMELVRQVRQHYGGMLKNVMTTPSGEVSLSLTVEQFRQLFDLPAEADTTDV